MRITTSQMFDRPMGLMRSLTADADTYQTQIATGKIQRAPSDDAGTYLRLQGLKRASADDSAYAANIKTAQGLLSESDSALASVQSQLQRAKELAMKAGNGTLAETDRQAIATELSSIRDALFAVANTRDSRGQPLFGGATGDTAFTQDADGTIRFAGAGEPAGIPTGEGVSVQATVSGERAFAAGDSDVFAVLANFIAVFSDGGDTVAAAGDAISGLDAALDQAGLARASVGARAARLDLDTERLTDTAEARETERSALEDTDIATAVTQLQKTLTVLQATQASFTKLSSMSLFDYLS